MSNFIAWGGGTGNSLTCSLLSPQAYGTLQLMGAGYITGSTATRYVTGVTDSKGGTWVSDSRRIGSVHGTDTVNGGNTLSMGPTFVRTDALGSNDLRPGDTVTATFEGSCTNNIFVVVQLGGLLDTITPHNNVGFSGGVGSAITDPYNDSSVTLCTNNTSNAFNVYGNFGAQRIYTGENLSELIQFVAMQPGQPNFRSSAGTLIDVYVSNIHGTVATSRFGDLGIAVSQRNVQPYTPFNIGGFLSNVNASNPKAANVLLGNYQLYDDPLFFNSSPGPVSLGGVASSPPLFVGTIKSKKH